MSARHCVDERALAIERQIARQVKRAGRDLHWRVRYHCTSMRDTAARRVVPLARRCFSRRAPAPAAAHPVPFSYLDLRLQQNAARRHARRPHLRRRPRSATRRRPSGCSSRRVVAAAAARDRDAARAAPAARRRRPAADARVVGRRDSARAAVAAPARPLRVDAPPGTVAVNARHVPVRSRATRRSSTSTKARR